MTPLLSGHELAFVPATPLLVPAIMAYLLKLQSNPEQAQQARQYQEQCLQALRELGQIWPQDKINALVTRLFYSALKHGTNALTVFTKSLLQELARDIASPPKSAQRSPRTAVSQLASPVSATTVVSEQERPLARAQQQLAQFYWKAAGGKAGLIQTRESLQQLRKTSSALAALPAAPSSAIAKLKSSLPLWLNSAEQYLNSVSRTGQSARLPQPPVGANSAVQEAVSAAVQALKPPGERETIKPRAPSEVGESAASEQRRKRAEQLQKAIDAAGTQWHNLPLERQKNIIAKTAARFGIDPGHLERALQARLNQLGSGATGGVRASSASTSSPNSNNDGRSVRYDDPDQRMLAQALKKIDPRLELADLPQEARRTLVFLLEFLFTQLPTRVVTTARTRAQNNQWQKSLDNPEIRGLLAEQAITEMAFSGIGSRTDVESGFSAIRSLIGDSAPRSTWKPESVSGNNSFEGFVKTLLDSKDPVVEQIRRALVYCLIEFYKLRAVDESNLLQSSLARRLGWSYRDITDMHLPDSPKLILESLTLIEFEGSLTAMKKELHSALDEYQKKRQMREQAGVAPPSN